MPRLTSRKALMRGSSPFESGRFRGRCAGYGTLTPMTGLDADTIRHALQTARERGFNVVKLRSGETSLTAELGEYEFEEESTSGAAPDVPGAAVGDTADIKAPVVGYVAQGKQPAAIGDPVKQGQPIFEVQALGIGNEAPAPISGTLVEILVEPGQPIQFGQTIARVRRASE